MSEFKIWECQVCAWVYDEAKGCPEEGLAPGTRWQDIPDDWTCPECGVGKADFDMVAISPSASSAVTAADPAATAAAGLEYSIWECQVCSWVYDESKGWPDDGIAPGTRWRDIPADWLCPECGVSKADFDMREVKRVAVTTALAAAQQAAPVVAPIVIIGSGLAAYNLVKEIRKLDSSSAIVLYTNDDGAFYSKPLLSTGFAKNKSAADLVSQSAEQMAEQYQLHIHAFSQVTSIDTQAKTVQVAGKAAQPYSKLVLATGANCIQPPLAGSGLDKVLSVNNLPDYGKFRAKAEGKKKILIIGAGLIGCEYANDLLQAGFQVEVVDPMPTVLASLLPPEASDSVEQALRGAGARFHFGTVVQQVTSEQDGVLVTLSDHQQIAADLVLSAIGVRPNTELAKAAGIATDRGIITDRRLQTSAPDVYAIGDCAQVENLVLYYILPMMAQVRALAKTLHGEPTQVQYGAMPVMVKTTLFPVVVNPPPRLADGRLAPGEWVIEQASSQGVKAIYRQGDQLLGFALTGNQVSAKAVLERQCPPLLV
ncbi:FAD-dependent oxidoreductase [Rheinheimera sp.]|uniref:FAD-dependent oxidoreductase n=1 Tax=Rheinheimera sp. TaxID=1869214 RepID=UPI00307E1604